MRYQIHLVFIFLLFSSTIFAQIVFEKGYLISNNNERIECFIKNKEWKYNPEEFEYYQIDESEIINAKIDEIIEFGILDECKYVRSNVEIDRSSKYYDKMSSERNPNFKKEQLFLKVIVEGDVCLYSFVDKNLTRFFFKGIDSEIKQLVYKKYLNADKNILENNYYRQQLSLELACEAISKKEFEYLRYEKSALERLFVKYYECMNSDFKAYNSKRKNDVFNLSIKTGLNYSNLVLENSVNDLWDAHFSNNYNIRLGVEAEYILPFNKNKWSVIIEPTYQYYKSDYQTQAPNISGNQINVTVDYSSIEIPFGVRHYFFLSKKSSIFADMTYIVDFAYDSDIEVTRIDNSVISNLEIKTRPNLGIGIGYKYNNRYSLELRYLTPRNILSDYLYYKTDYKTVSFIFGYTLF